MLLRRWGIENSYSKVSENIKRDLLSTFEKKGIDISKVQIDMKSGTLSVFVDINKK